MMMTMDITEVTVMAVLKRGRMVKDWIMDRALSFGGFGRETERSDLAWIVEEDG
jgi:hypothetical protein